MSEQGHAVVSRAATYTNKDNIVDKDLSNDSHEEDGTQTPGVVDVTTQDSSIRDTG